MQSNDYAIGQQCYLTAILFNKNVI